MSTTTTEEKVVSNGPRNDATFKQKKPNKRIKKATLSEKEAKPLKRTTGNPFIETEAAGDDDNDEEEEEEEEDDEEDEDDEENDDDEDEKDDEEEENKHNDEEDDDDDDATTVVDTANGVVPKTTAKKSRKRVYAHNRPLKAYVKAKYGLPLGSDSLRLLNSFLTCVIDQKCAMYDELYRSRLTKKEPERTMFVAVPYLSKLYHRYR